MDNFWSLLGVLAVVILILYLAYFATRWIGMHGASGGTAALRAGGAGEFRLLAQLGVGRNERLVLARLNKRCYLLGVTEHQITLLRELDDEEAAAWLAQGDGASAAPGFMDVLNETLRRKK